MNEIKKCDCGEELPNGGRIHPGIWIKPDEEGDRELTCCSCGRPVESLSDMNQRKKEEERKAMIESKEKELEECEEKKE